MEDDQIIELYNRRDEEALAQTRSKYGEYLAGIAAGLLDDARDAEECVSDALLAAWGRIPPEEPASLKLFIGRIVRNLSISRYRKEHAQRRFAQLEPLLAELEECIPAGTDVERQAESRELAALISSWLRTQSAKDRALFIRRYWHGESVSSLSEACGCRPGELSLRMFRLRKKLKAYLEKEGVEI